MEYAQKNMMDAPYTTCELETCGHFVRTKRCPDDMRGLIIAEFPFDINPKYKGDANLFVAAKDLLDVANLVLDTATCHTPQELVEAATLAINKATPNSKVGEHEECKQTITVVQRDWLLATLWEYANMINNYEIHVGLDRIGHENCEACGGTGRVLDGELCAFGDEHVRAIKGL